MRDTGRTQVVERLEVRRRRVDARHVGLQPHHRIDDVGDVAELGRTQVRVDPGRVGDAGGGEAERLDSPAQVVPPCGAADRQGVAQGGLVHLDHPDPRRLQITHLVAEREGDLGSRLRPWLVVPHERARQDRHRPHEHALHRPIGAALRPDGPVHGERRRAGDVAEHDRRPHAPGPVGLHPAVLGGHEPVQVLRDETHHVRTANLAGHRAVWHRAVWHRPAYAVGALCPRTYGIGGPADVFRSQRGQPSAHPVVPHPRGPCPRGSRLPRVGQRLRDRVRPDGQRATEGDDLPHLLH
ncbi:hypothetical protein ACZ91_46005, partial [Streptomyces regensis]